MISISIFQKAIKPSLLVALGRKSETDESRGKNSKSIGIVEMVSNILQIQPPNDKKGLGRSFDNIDDKIQRSLEVLDEL